MTEVYGIDLKNAEAKWKSVIENIDDNFSKVKQLTKNQKLSLYAELYTNRQKNHTGNDTKPDISNNLFNAGDALPLSLKTLFNLTNLDDVVIVDNPIIRVGDSNMHISDIQFMVDLDKYDYTTLPNINSVDYLKDKLVDKIVNYLNSQVNSTIYLYELFVKPQVYVIQTSAYSLTNNIDAKAMCLCRMLITKK